MKLSKKILCVLMTGVFAAAVAAGCGGGQSSSGSSSASTSQKAAKANFPKKQLSIVVPYAPGGASDTVARIFAQELEKQLGKPVVVSNKTGASGAVGLEAVKNSAPDGYTIAYMPVESTMISSLGFTDLTSNDFKFIGRVMTIPAAITVRKDAPWNTLEEFIQYAKANPEKIQVGNSGTGSIWQVAAASLEEAAGIKFTHVPFDGAAPAIAALMGGNIQAVAVSPAEVKSNVDAGDFKVLAILGDKPSSVVPDVPTATSLGYKVAAMGWGGFAVPKDTPDDVVQILSDAADKAINTDNIKKLLKDRGFEFAYMSGKDMDAFAKDQLQMYQELIPKLGIVQK